MHRPFNLSLKKARNKINKTNFQKEAAVIINKKEFKVFYTFRLYNIMFQ